MKRNLPPCWRILIRCFTIALCSFLLWKTELPAQAAPENTPVPQLTAAANAQSSVDPLPGGCIGNTPAGEEPPLCCISGFVFLNGQKISNAQVTIVDQNGPLTQAPTEVYDTVHGPYYRINLAGLTRPITPTDVITIYATFSGLTSAPVRHTVQRDGQQVNLLLYDPNPNALALAGQTQGKGEPGKLAGPVDVATDRWGNLYVIDFNQRVQVFDPQGQLLIRPQWDKGYGDLPNQLGLATGIAVDQHLDRVYISDALNRRVGVYTTDGDLRELWDGTNTPQQQRFEYLKDVTVDDQSNVYVLEHNLYDADPDRIYKFDEQGNFLKQWAIHVYDPRLSVWHQQIAVTAAGEILLSDLVYDKVDSGYALRAGGVYKSNGIDPFLPFTVTFPAELASSPVISMPTGIATGVDGSIYLYDLYPTPTGNWFPYTGRVLQMNAQGVVTRAWNYPAFEPDPLKRITDGYGMTVHGDTLFLAERGHNKIFRLNLAAGGLRESWGEQARGAGQLMQPRGLAIAPPASPWAGSLFVVDYPLNRLSRIVDDTIVQSWDISTGSSLSTSAWHIAFDPQGKLYTVNMVQNLIVRYVISDTQLIVDGGPWSGILHNNERAGIAIDKNNRLYLTHPSANRVVIYDPTNPITLTKLAVYDGSANELSVPLNNPSALAVDDSNPDAVLVYVTNLGNDRLLILKYANGALTYQDSWGRPADGSLDRVCRNKDDTPLGEPMGVAVGPNQTIYVANQRIDSVIKFDKTGACLGQFGSYAPGPDQIDAPEGLAVAADGTLFVGDASIRRILRLNPLAPVKPIATIVHLSSTDLVPGDGLTVLGAGQPGNNAHVIDQYEWTTTTGLAINSAGPTVAIPTGEGATTTDRLGPGSHQLRLRVHSSSGEWSEPTTYSVYVAHRRPVAVPPDTPPPATDCPAGSLWTFLLYLDADYTDAGRLSSAYSEARAALAGVNHSCVQFAIQIDGPASIGQPAVGDSRRWIVRPRPFTEQLLPAGEAPMDAAAGLADFIIWGQQTLPADHYYLAIANHGDGARGIAWDHTTATDNSAYLTAAEIRSALERTEIAPIDILHLDACSMGLLDVAYQLRTKVKALITSQYLGWSFFAYAGYAQTITLAITPAQLATNIVNHYAALAEHLHLPYTLAAWDLTRIEPVKNGVDDLSILLKAWVGNDNSNHERRDQLNALRSASQLFDSNANFINSPVDAYLDLVDWLTRLQSANLNGDITQAATKLLTELQRADGLILTNRAQSNNLPPQYQNGATVNLSGAYGVSIYYPLQGELRLALPQQATSAAPLAATTAYSYTQLYADYINQKLFDFTLASHWDEFLRASYGAPIPGLPLESPSAPLAPLNVPRQLYLPLITR